MREHIQIKERHCAPTKFDIEPFGTIYKVTNEALNFDYYIQLSREGNTIDWRPMAFLLTELFGDLYENIEFIEELLFLYQDDNKSIKTFTRMLESYLK